MEDVKDIVITMDDKGVGNDDDVDAPINAEESHLKLSILAASVQALSTHEEDDAGGGRGGSGVGGLSSLRHKKQHQLAQLNELRRRQGQVVLLQDQYTGLGGAAQQRRGDTLSTDGVWDTPAEPLLAEVGGDEQEDIEDD